MKIAIIGDIHAKFHALNYYIEKQHPDIIIQCGDNAYYWNKSNEGIIKPHNTKIYFIPGNHENWDIFEEKIGRYGKDPIEVEKNIFMCPIGSTLNINDKKFLFIGGADSVDKEWRLLKVSWWNQEILNEKDWNYINQNVDTADVIISHTCPVEFIIPFAINEKVIDPSRYVLSEVLKKYKPNLWYFGHWHSRVAGNFENTQYIGLNMLFQIDLSMNYDPITKIGYEPTWLTYYNEN